MTLLWRISAENISGLCDADERINTDRTATRKAASFGIIPRWIGKRIFGLRRCCLVTIGLFLCRRPTATTTFAFCCFTTSRCSSAGPTPSRLSAPGARYHNRIYKLNMIKEHSHLFVNISMCPLNALRYGTHFVHSALRCTAYLLRRLPRRSCGFAQLAITGCLVIKVSEKHLHSDFRAWT